MTMMISRNKLTVLLHIRVILFLLRWINDRPVTTLQHGSADTVVWAMNVKYRK